MTKRGLGKGLHALISDAVINNNDNSIQEVRLTDIDPNERQPRKSFDDESLQQLCQSIKQHGVVQPIILHPEGNRYTIVAGERRWRAAKMAGLKTIPAIIRKFHNREIIEIALIENLQREDLNPIEEAEALKTLMTEYNLTQEQISERIGRSRSYIANSIRLTTLSPRIKEYIANGDISSGHGRALLAFEDEKLREEMAKEIIKNNLTVRDVERIASQLKGKTAKKQSRNKQKSPHIIELENNLERVLGTKVKITPGRKKGKIEIEYYSQEDLDRILEVMAGNP
ncbi:MAG TPA: ParB/RepB/Spo0J family partition protein [Clostridiales bacterium]|nr:ParB/RepB/Spo0J family partition protein [Clostridiales bacterium]